MDHPVSKKGFIQINIVVRDIELAARKWAELLGVEVPVIRINHLEGGENYTYRGEPVSCDLKVCNIHMDGFVIELHEPAGGPSSFQEFWTSMATACTTSALKWAIDAMRLLKIWRRLVMTWTVRWASIPAAVGPLWTLKTRWV